MAAFSFGGVAKNTTKLKNLSRELVDELILDHFDQAEDDYYIFLLDQKPNNTRLGFLKQDITKVGYKSYIILQACKVEITKEELEKEGFLNFYLENESRWKKYIDYNGKHARAIMAFGSALYAINKESELQASHFMADKFFNPYYYIGHGFIGDFDTFIYPVFAPNIIYPVSKMAPGKKPENLYSRHFTKILDRMLHDEQELPDIREHRIVLIEDQESATKTIQSLYNSEVLAVDLETSSLDFYTGKIGCITMCADGVTGYYIPWQYVNKRLLSGCLKSSTVLVGQNGKFDIKFLWKNGIDRSVYFTDDTLLLHHCLHSDRPHGLKPTAFLTTGLGGYENELKTFLKTTKISNYLDIPHKTLSQYAVLDAIVTWRAYKHWCKVLDKVDRLYLNDKMSEWTIERFYNQIMMPISKIVCDMEYEGVNVDIDMMARNRKIIKDEADKYKHIVCEELGVPDTFEIGSTDQLGELLKSKKWPCIEESKKGGYSTSDNCLKEWAKIKPEYKKVTDAISKYRSMMVFIKTFIGAGDLKNPVGWEEHMRFKDGTFNEWVIHQSYFVMGAVTYRFIGKDPNFQQIPQHDKMSKYVKQCLVPPSEKWYKITNDDGTIYDVPYGTQFQTQRGLVFVQDLNENDTIIDDNKMPSC